jgi:hypothetical protein
MDKTVKLLQSKLRRPIHITYISEHILKKDMNETRTLINKLMEEGYVFESETSKDYFYIKPNE